MLLVYSNMVKQRRKTKREIEIPKHASRGRKTAYVLGVDEVGRGPLAGPVTVCVSKISTGTVSVLKKELRNMAGKPYPVGKDSKKMTEKEREFWFSYLKKAQKKKLVEFNIASKSAKHIDTLGISVCIRRLVNSLVSKSMNGVDSEDVILLADRGLKADLSIKQQDIVKGDEKEFVISIASVYAKVTRDMYMKKISKKKEYTVYGFELHKGYGTKKHRDVIGRIGLGQEHRRSFCKRFTDV
ncbi:MAG: ribonuclease HII [Candidatus Taylorbacteria bacterium]|nr:ribonuclease HII [Candidatus Taylorbacteria bacterium]